MKPLLWTSLLALTMNAPAWAHEAWVALSGPRHEILYGHLEQPDRHYDLAKIKRLLAFDGAGHAVAVELSSGQHPATVAAAKAAIFLLDFDNGFWSKTTAGSKNLPKNQVPDALSGMRSLKYGKTVLAWGPLAQKAFGQRLEVIPEIAAAPKAGTNLPLRVEFDGKPLAGASVQLEGYQKSVVKTGADGRANIGLGPTGMQVIVAGHEVKLDQVEADSEKHSANLVFEAR